MHFTLGVLSFTYAGARLPQVPFAVRVAGDEEWLLRQLIQFLAAGLRAPPLMERVETAV
mgnify:FL=1